MQRFVFSPSSLLAFPLLGAGLGWLAIILVPLLAIASVPRWAALAAWSAGAAALGLVVYGVAAGWAAQSQRGALREDANLIAVRPGAAQVRRWIVAHADTKAQGHSMAGRLVAVWFVVSAALLLTLLAALRLRGPVPLWAVGAGAGLAIVAGALAGRGRLRGGGPGARDNGTGVVAALAAAEALEDSSTGILVTGAEEFGLVGARVFARTSPERLRGTEVVNLDTLDEEGTLWLVSHDAAGEQLAERLRPALAGLGLPLGRRRLPLGIFVDSHPLARGGAAAVTIGRLTWTTLRRIHTFRDTAEGLSFETAERVGRVLAADMR